MNCLYALILASLLELFIIIAILYIEGSKIDIIVVIVLFQAYVNCQYYLTKLFLLYHMKNYISNNDVYNIMITNTFLICVLMIMCAIYFFQYNIDSRIISTTLTLSSLSSILLHFIKKIIDNYNLEQNLNQILIITNNDIHNNNTA